MILFGLSLSAIFYVAFFAAMSIIYVLSEKTNAGFYILALVATAYWLFFGGGSLVALLELLPLILTYAAVYTGVGLLWSFYKWYRFTHMGSTIAEYKDYFEAFTKNENRHNPKDKSVNIKSFKTHRKNPLYFRNHTYKLHKWVIYWPISMVASIFGNILYDGLVYIIKSFGKVYDSISGNGQHLS